MLLVSKREQKFWVTFIELSVCDVRQSLQQSGLRLAQPPLQSKEHPPGLGPASHRLAPGRIELAAVLLAHTAQAVGQLQGTRICSKSCCGVPHLVIHLHLDGLALSLQSMEVAYRILVLVQLSASQPARVS